MSPTCLVTGANSGIGRVTALELARRGAEVVVACRSAERAAAVVEEIRRGGGRAEFLHLDLSSLAKVRDAAQAFLAMGKPLHVLVNNAGVAGRSGLTKDGFEFTFGVNHLGHFLLTRLLEPALIASAPARVVTVASKAHYAISGIDFDQLRSPAKPWRAFRAYRVSKLANVLFSAELGRRLESRGVHTYSLHPGVIASDIWRQVPWPIRPLMKLRMKSNEEGARTTLYCATRPELVQHTGLYYDDCAVTQPSLAAQDKALATRLWEQSDAWVTA